jgi:hypothetical protein
MVGHFVPFGRYRKKPLADVPADYLGWLLRTCKLSSGLRAAVAGELRRRGHDVPPQPVPPPPRCRSCGGAELCLSWQELGGAGGRTIRGECRRCGHFVSFLPLTEENVRRADAARSPTGLLDALVRADDEGVRVVSDAGHLRLVPPGKASPALARLVRENTKLLLSLLGRGTDGVTET